MAYELTHPLVIGISSRALFDLEKENRIFEEQGLQAYIRYQLDHEKDILPVGPGYPLIRAFLRLNQLQKDKRIVEVIIVSRTSPDTSLRIFNSIQHYGLDITRASLVSGASVTPYLKALQADLYLSADEPSVKDAINHGIAAGVLLTGSFPDPDKDIDQIRIAFDGDAVLFSSASERIFQQNGLTAFTEHERDNASVPLTKGPFAAFLMTLSNLQAMYREREQSPIRTALVTSRSVPCHERAIRTLREWGVRIDEAFFLGDVRKREILEAFGAHIFFDDQPRHAIPASDVVPSALVPYREDDNPMN